MSGASSSAPLLVKNELIFLNFQSKCGAFLEASTRAPYWAPAVVTSVSTNVAGLLVLAGLNAPISVFAQDCCVHVDLMLSNMKLVKQLRSSVLLDRDTILFSRFGSHFDLFRSDRAMVRPEGKDFWDKFTKRLRHGRDKVLKNFVPSEMIDIWKDACWHAERGWNASNKYANLFNHVDDLFGNAGVTKTAVMKTLPSFTVDAHVLRRLKVFYESKRFPDVVDLSGPSPPKNDLLSTVLEYLSTGLDRMPENWVSMDEKRVYYVSDDCSEESVSCFELPTKAFKQEILRGGDAILSQHDIPQAQSVREFRAMLCERKGGQELWKRLLDDDVCLTRAVYAWSWMIPAKHLAPLCSTNVTVKVPITGSCCKCSGVLDGMAGVRLACGAVCHVNCLRKHFHEHRFGVVRPREVPCACEGCGMKMAKVLPRQECACCCCPWYSEVFNSIFPENLSVPAKHIYFRVATYFICRVMPLMNTNRVEMYSTSEGIVLDLVERDQRVPNSALLADLKPMIRRVWDDCFGSTRDVKQLLKASNDFMGSSIVTLGPCYMRTENFHVRQTFSRGRGVFCTSSELASGTPVALYSQPVADYIDASKPKTSLLIVGGFDRLWEALVDRYSEYVMQVVKADTSFFDSLWNSFYRDRVNRRQFTEDKDEVKAKFLSPVFSLYVNKLILSETLGICDRPACCFEGLFWEFVMQPRQFKELVQCLGAVVIPLNVVDGAVQFPSKSVSAFVNRPNPGEKQNAKFCMNREDLSIVVKLTSKVRRDEEILAPYDYPTCRHFGGKHSLADIANSFSARTNDEKRVLSSYLDAIGRLFRSKRKDMDFLFSRLTLSVEEAPEAGLKHSLILFYSERQWWPCLVTAAYNNKVNLRCLRTDLELSQANQYGRIWKDIALEGDITAFMEEPENTLADAVSEFKEGLEGCYCLLKSAMVLDPSEVPIPARLSCAQAKQLKSFFSGKSLKNFFATKRQSWSSLNVEQQRRACYYAMKEMGWDFFHLAGVEGVELEESFNLQFFDRETVTAHLPYVYNHVVGDDVYCMKVVRISDGQNGAIVAHAEPFLCTTRNDKKDTFLFDSFAKYMEDFYRRWDGKEIAFESDPEGVQRVLKNALFYSNGDAPVAVPVAAPVASDEAAAAMALSDLSTPSSDSEEEQAVVQTVSVRKKRKKGLRNSLYTLRKRPRNVNVQYK